MMIDDTPKNTHYWNIMLYTCTACGATIEMVRMNMVPAECPGPAHKAMNERRFREMANTHLGVMVELLGKLIRLGR